MNCWSILGIEATSNKKDIKRAYSKLLKSYHPAEDPEGFQRLNEAYQLALSLADESSFEPLVTEHVEPANTSLFEGTVKQSADNAELPETFEQPENPPSSLSENAHSNPDELTSSTEPTADSDTVEHRVPSPSSELSIDNDELSSQRISNEEASPESMEQINSNDLSIVHQQSEADSFIAAIETTLALPNLRKDNEKWQTLLNQLTHASFEFKEAVFVEVFQCFADFYSANVSEKDGTYIPHNVVPAFAEMFDWKNRELDLIKYLPRESVNLVMIQAYGYDQQSSEYQDSTPWQRRAKMGFNFVKWMAVFVGLTLVFDALLDSKRNSASEEEVVIDKTAWSEELQVCAELNSPEPSEQLDSCQKLAEDGWLKAQYHLAWIYSRDSDFKDWQIVFNNLKRASFYDTHAELLSYIVLFRLGSDKDEVETGEKGIKQLANEGFAPAQAFQSVMYFRNENRLKKTMDPAYLLEEAYHSGESMVTEFEMAIFYFNGFSRRPNPQLRSFEVLDDSAKNDFPIGTNNVAWFLATLDNNPLAESNYALELAKSVVEAPEYQDSLAYIDTLAATYAAAGNFTKAIDLQNRAIELIDTSDMSDSQKEAHKKDFAQRLAKYYEDTTDVIHSLSIDKSQFFDDLNEELGTRLFLRIRNGSYRD